MWIMTTDFSELTPRQTRRVVRFTEPTFLMRSSPRADWRDAKLRGKTLFVVRHFVTLMAGTSRACSAVFETCHIHTYIHTYVRTSHFMTFLHEAIFPGRAETKEKRRR